MSGTNRNNPRARPARPGSTPGGRPRRVAGQPAVPARPREVEEPDPAPEPEVGLEIAPEVGPAVEPEVDPGPAVEPAETPATVTLEKSVPQAVPRPRPRRRTTVVLVAVVVVLLGVGAAESVYLLRDDPTRISESRPVLASELTVRSTVDKAAQALKVLVTTTPDDYDAEVETATAMMTGPFAEEFRTTKADVKDAVVSQQVSTTVEISGQGVVTATDQEVVALIFFTQYTQKGATGAVVPAQYKAEVTMSNTSDGWLVSDVQTL